MKIPLSQLRFGKSKEQEWGIQLRRKFFRETVYSTWQSISVNAPGWVSEFGILRGLKGLIPQKQFEIQPYVVSQFKSYPMKSDNPFGDRLDNRIHTGIDAKIGVANDLTLDVTVNPDFGQVEADPSTISLDGFQIFFEERRPFFVENKNIFTYSFRNNLDNLFYSRRIGMKPETINLADESLNLSLPPSTTIPFATKFSGKTENGWSVGILEAVTSKEYATAQDIGGIQDKILVEPFANYFVGRIQKDSKSRNTYIGGIATATHRKIEATVDKIHSAAYSGGIDFKHSWGNRNYYLEGSFVASQIMGSADAIKATQESIGHLFNRSDASYLHLDPTRTSLSGTGGKLAIGKVGGGHFQYSVGFEWVSPELELNDIGFLRQSDEIIESLFIGYKTLRPFSNFREISARFNQSASFDFGGVNNIQSFISEINATFMNNSEITMTGGYKPRNFINSYLRGGPKWRNSPEIFEYLQVGTNPRKKITLLADQRYTQSLQQDFSAQIYSTSLRYQPINSIGVSIDTQYERNKTFTQYVSQQNFDNEMKYITARLDNETLSFNFRFYLTLSPNLTIQYYSQPFISRGKYDRFNYVLNPRAKLVDERVYVYPNDQIFFDRADKIIQIDEDQDGNNDYSFSNPDFSLIQFRSNLVLRWEYITGSEVYLVWSQGLNESVYSDSGLLTSLRSSIKPQKLQNILLVKLTYRFIK